MLDQLDRPSEGSVAKASRALRVAQVIGSFGGGGAERLAYNLAKGLCKAGHRSYAIATRAAGVQEEVPGVTMFELHADRGGIAGLLSAALRLRRFVRHEGIEVLHVHGAPSLPFIVLATRGMRRQPRILFTWQDSESVLTRGKWRRLMKWSLRRCNSVSGSSRAVAAALREHARLGTVGIFHGGVPVTPPAPAHRADPPLILWVGRLVPPKDPQILVRAAARLRSEGLAFRILIAGQPNRATQWYQQQTRDLIRQLHMDDWIEAPGYVPDDQLAEALRQASLAVQTSRTEGLSIALMEYMMASLAIVATDVGDTAEAIGDAGAGWVIPPEDENALVSALHTLLADDARRERLGQAARKRALEQYSLTAMAERARSEYAALLRNPPPAGPAYLDTPAITTTGSCPSESR